MTPEKWIVAGLALAFYVLVGVQFLRARREMRKANDEYKIAWDCYCRAANDLYALRTRIAETENGEG